MIFRCQTSRPASRGRYALGGGAALVVLAAGLGAGARVVPPVSDVYHSFPRQATEGLQGRPPVTDSQERAFVSEAGQLNLLEARLGELALQKSSRPAVQDYARRMIADHARLHEELASVAGSSHDAVPNNLDEPGAKTAARLAALRGADFDFAYLVASVSDHEAALAAFQNLAAGTAAGGLPQPPLVPWARRTVPLLAAQLRLGQALHEELAAAETPGGM